MARNGHIRVGTDERERAVAALGEHFAEGRLDVAEYEARCGAAVAARTQGELDALFADLPKPAPAARVAVPERNPLIERSTSRDTRRLVAGFAILASLGTAVVVAITGVWVALIPALLVGLVAFMLT